MQTNGPSTQLSSTMSPRTDQPRAHYGSCGHIPLARTGPHSFPCEAGSCSSQSLLLRSSSRERRSASHGLHLPMGGAQVGPCLSLGAGGCLPAWRGPCLSRSPGLPCACGPISPASCVPHNSWRFLLIPLRPRGSVRPHLRRSSSLSFVASDCPGHTGVGHSPCQHLALGPRALPHQEHCSTSWSVFRSSGLRKA